MYSVLMNGGHDTIRDIFQSLEQMLVNLPSLRFADYIKQARGVCVCVWGREGGGTDGEF